MVVERIDKVTRLEGWRVQESSEAKKGGQNSGQETGKDAFAALHEKTDWQILFEKSRLWKQNIQISRDEIEKVLFHKINLKTDPSLLRVDILLKRGEKISPAFLAVSRATGLKIKNLKQGEPIPEEYILKNNILRVIIPTNPALFADEAKPQPAKPANPANLPPEEKTVGGAVAKNRFLPEIRDPVTGQLRLEIIFVYGVAFLILSTLITGLLLLL